MHKNYNTTHKKNLYITYNKTYVNKKDTKQMKNLN